MFGFMAGFIFETKFRLVLTLLIMLFRLPTALTVLRNAPAAEPVLLPGWLIIISLLL